MRCSGEQHCMEAAHEIARILGVSHAYDTYSTIVSGGRIGPEGLLVEVSHGQQ